ncbi:formimidoylglutamate deiminase [Rugosimonospora africana]|uniref:Formimidoylglutamate deiminase n=1 Tax=Rugosimonospora africana TaxID=556532 RepID=A0A8J3VP18_9ACTN|nr:formimidoylglutamate deiminase [Rugosimonospora africana]GIH12896.1 formimidoylglutamate deiminase [Rugosimonospora africana]
MTAPARYHAEYAWLGGQTPVRDVLIEVVDGVIAQVRPAPPGTAATRLPGLTLPGLANAHSHAFHRALRGRAGSARVAPPGADQSPGNFWTWREGMYALADRLDPDSYHRLARAVYGEMALAGITAVGEFHYLHHAPGGARYADPNAMSDALVAAAAEAGIRITLLDTLYLTSTVDGDPLEGTQLRFGDGALDGWVARASGLRLGPHARRGAAIHSVRAVPAETIGGFVAATEGLPVHAHLSEQPAENEACLARYGRTPTELLHSYGALHPGTTVVHATHLSEVDSTLLGDTGTAACFCPTTERDLADGIGPARTLADAGSPLCLGSDSHAVVDLFEEARAMELDERLRTRRRGHFSPAELLTAATAAGHRAIGWPDAGTLAVGKRADLVTVDLHSVRTAGSEPLAGAVLAATAADVTHVVVDGRPVVRDGRHVSLDVAGELRAAIEAVTR